MYELKSNNPICDITDSEASMIIKSLKSEIARFDNIDSQHTKFGMPDMDAEISLEALKEIRKRQNLIDKLVNKL